MSLICVWQVNAYLLASRCLRLSLSFSNEHSHTMFRYCSIIDLFTHLIFKFFRQNQNDSPNKNLISSYKHIRVLLRRRWINFNWAKKLIMSSNIVYKQFGSFFVYNANEKRTLDRKKLMTFSCALSFDTWTRAIAQHLSMWQFQLGWHKKIQIVR